MRIAVYGGSFNPPHIGHLAAARAAAEQLEPDILLIVPALHPPHKQMADGSPKSGERLRLLEPFAVTDKVLISDIELRREGPSYTADTLLEIMAEYPEAELFLLVGTDMAATITQWYRFKWILANVTLAVFTRSGAEEAELRDVAAGLVSEYGARIRFIRKPDTDISSTRVREMLPERRGPEYLSDAVYSRIIQKRHYSAQPELNWLRVKALEFYDSRRYGHMLGVEKEAVALARRWGGDEAACAEAAILHDITKSLDSENQLLLCEKYAIIIDNWERGAEKLLHAKTGAYLAREAFGVGGEVFSAIYYHTTGRPGMTLTEKILYMADYIEPARHFDGVTKLRELAYIDLDAAMILGLQMSIDEVEAKGGSLHPITLETLNDIMSKRTGI